MRITPGMLVLGGVTVVISFVAAPLTGNSGVLGGPCNQCRGCVMVESAFAMRAHRLTHARFCHSGGQKRLEAFLKHDQVIR